jgi:hypothetical protein
MTVWRQNEPSIRDTDELISDWGFLPSSASKTYFTSSLDFLDSELHLVAYQRLNFLV